MHASGASESHNSEHVEHKFVVGAVGQSSAQERTFAIEGTGGYVGFADDGIVGHSLIGAAARWYVLPRISIGPEIQFMAGEGGS